VKTVLKKFLELCIRAKTVICCRVTPQQKAQVVQLVKQRKKKVTLAIGDGGNDVGMIQMASVGVGISGREGLQASRAADYSFAKFKFLKRLILVHGRRSYKRTALIAQYSFYKSLLIAFIQICYSYYTLFSGVTFFDGFALTVYNLVFTGIPIFFYLLDKDLPDETLIEHPDLYKETQRSKNLTVGTIIGWIALAAVQAVIVFWMTIYIFGTNFLFRQTGFPIDYVTISFVTYTVIIFINSTVLAYETHSFTWINHVCIWGMPILYFIVMTISNIIPSNDFYYVMMHLYVDPVFWISVLLMTIAATGPIIAIKFYMFAYHPMRYQIERKKMWLTKHSFTVPQNLLPRSISTTSMASGMDQEMVSIDSNKKRTNITAIAFEG